MIELATYRPLIEKFWQKAIKEFSVTNANQQISCVAFYCCPWSGWLMISFDTEHEDNCPDFTFFEFDMIKFDEWQREYEEQLVLQVVGESGKMITIDQEKEGDEGFNQVVFEYLKKILQNDKMISDTKILNLKNPFRFGVQMLDSEYEEFWVVN